MNATRLHVLGVDFRTAPAAVREALAFDEAQARELLARALVELPGLAGLVVSTCNRVEFWVTDPGDGWRGLLSLLRSIRPDAPILRDDCRLYHHEGADAMRHMCHVTTGLSSSVLGDLEITGQVRAALRVAEDVGTVDSLLRHSVLAAIRCAAEVRRDTDLSRGQASVGSAVAAMIGRRSGAQPLRVVILGAGQIATGVAMQLAKLGMTVTISNRTRSAAERLAERCGASSIAWEERSAAIELADVLVAATASKTPIVGSEVDRVHGSPLWIIDAGMPRNVAAGVASEVTNVDAIHQVRGRALARREASVPAATQLAERAVADWEAWVRARPVEELLSQLYRRLDASTQALANRLDELGSADDENADMRRYEIRRAMKELLHLHARGLRMFARGTPPQLERRGADAVEVAPSRDAFVPGKR